MANADFWDAAATSFSGLPYFSPMMMINTSETCASRRLLQCREMGISMNDVSRKFSRSWSPDSMPDLSQDEWKARKSIIEFVEAWCEKKKAESEARSYSDEWVPILYRYEIVKMSAKRDRDWGHLIFSDMTNTRFLLVMVFPAACNCGNLSHHDYDALTKYHADRFMSLLKYLFHDPSNNTPDWVRATYTTKDLDYKLDPQFLESQEPPVEGSQHKIYHVTPDNFVPSILENEFEKIESVMAQSRPNKSIPDDVKAQVLGSKETRPEVSGAWTHKNPRQCGACGKMASKDLMQCGRCKLVRYCNRDCQKSHWPSHKIFCKKGPERST